MSRKMVTGIRINKIPGLKFRVFMGFSVPRLRQAELSKRVRARAAKANMENNITGTALSAPNKTKARMIRAATGRIRMRFDDIDLVT